MEDFVDSTAAKIVLAADGGDSISRISSKIGTSYSWTYDWIGRLVEADIIANTDNGIRVLDHEIRRRYEALVAALYRRNALSIDDSYVVPHYSGMEFSYTEIDAAYVWTHGGYQIARNYEDYPVFLRVHDSDVERWIAFFDRFGVETTVGERPDPADIDTAVHYVLYPDTSGFDIEWVDGNPVIPLSEAIDRMTDHRPAYEPALERIADEHDVDIDATHHGDAYGGGNS